MSADRHAPLDTEERELARIMRALPAAEPPASLDARILAMAHDAAPGMGSAPASAAPPQHPRLAWGLGVAASCVLAASVVWRMGGFGPAALDEAGAPAAMSAPSAARQPAPAMEAAEPERIPVDFGPASPPAPPTVSPPPPPVASEAPRAVAQRREAERREQRERVAAPAPPPAAAPMAPAVAMAAAEAADAGPASNEGTAPPALAPADPARYRAEDGSAGAQAWLQRIRARIARGDLAGARASLEAFVATHPGKPLPQDLIDFRREAEGR